MALLRVSRMESQGGIVEVDGAVVVSKIVVQEPV